MITQYRNGADPYAGGQHRGIDIAAAAGTPVVAAAGGEVRFAGTAGSSGLTVSVRTADGFDTSYLHLSSFAVRAGARVSAGERVGAVGTTGTRSAVQPHLHFGVREAGTRHAYVDPLSMLPPATAPPPSEAPRPVPAPAPAPLSPRPAPAPEPAPRGAPRPAPVPRGVPRPAPAPRGAPRPAPRPASGAPGPRAPSRAPAPAPRPRPRLSRGARPPHGPCPSPSTHATRAQSLDPHPRPNRRWHRRRGQHRGQHLARGSLQLPLHPIARAAPAGSSGPDFGWALACAGLLLAAGVLGLTDDGRKATARGRSCVAGRAAPSTRQALRRCRPPQPGAAAGSIDGAMPYYVTTPIYYVNGEPHLGHAYTTIAADVLARHMRQRGEDVFFLTGTDEHGEPVAQEAERLGITPRELGDRNAVRFKELAATVNVTNDFFIRTTDPEHMAKVAEVVQRIYDNGHVYAGHYEGWYCPRCADFKTEAELEDGNRCPIHKIVLEIEKEDNWFFRLSTFQEPLERLYAERPDFVTPQNRYNEALSFIKGGLRDVSLSRARLKWGVPVPWDESQVVYVWIDALLNYYTALSYARPGEDLTEKFWPATVHLIGKDILKFHAVIWPAMLMAAGNRGAAEGRHPRLPDCWASTRCRSRSAT